MLVRPGMLLAALAACHGEAPTVPDAGPAAGPEVIWTGPPSALNPLGKRATKIVLDGDNVYWLFRAPSGSSSVFKRAKSGGPVEAVTSGSNVFDLALQGGHVYWTETPATWGLQTGSVMRAPKTGGAPSTVVADQWSPMWLTVDSQRVYWIADADATHAWGKFQLRSLELGGAEVRLLDGSGWYDALAVDDQFVYWSTNGLQPGVKRVAKVGGAVSGIVAETVTAPIAIDGSYLYYEDQQTRLKQLPLSGGAPRIITDTGAGERSLAIVGPYIYTAVYFGYSPPDAIVEVAINTGQVTLVDLNQGPNQHGHDMAWGVAADTSYIYWTRDHGDHSELVRAPPPRL